MIGPRGDSPCGSQKEMCFTNAACLFRKKRILSCSVPRESILLAAGRILSWFRSERSWLRPSGPLAFPVSCLVAPSSEASRVTVGKRLRIAVLTFSSSSVGLTSASTVTDILRRDVSSDKVFHLRLELGLCSFIYDHDVGEGDDGAYSDFEFTLVSLLEGCPALGVVASTSAVEAVEACLWGGM